MLLEKSCARCNETKAAEHFYEHKKMKDGLHSYCKACIAEKGRLWRIANPERRRESNRRNKARARALNPRRERSWQMKSLYGITLDEYEEMLSAQGGVCAICRRPPGRRRLHVDHHHKTGEVRSLLCSKCNTAIGLFDEDPELMAEAILYLRGWNV